MVVDVSLFVSLLFVVIIEIGGIARSLDLEQVSEAKLPPFFVGVFFFLDTGPQQRVSVPQLGRFNFLHGANLAIIILGFVLVTENTSGINGLLIALVTVTIWLLLPLFEVDEYEAILMDGFRPVSYYHHVVITVATALFIYYYDLVWGLVPAGTSFELVQQLTFTGGCLLGYYISLFGFLRHLERELDREHLDRLPDRITQT